MDTEIIKNIWNCVRNTEPRTWALGDQHGQEMKNIRAWVWRADNGSWLWETSPRCHGREPSRDTAMEAAQRALLLPNDQAVPARHELGTSA